MKQLITFLKYNRRQFDDIVYTYLYLNNELSREECEKFSRIVQTFIDIIENLSVYDTSIFTDGVLNSWYIQNESYLTVDKLKKMNRILNYGIEEGQYEEVQKDELTQKITFLFEFFIFIAEKNQSLEVSNKTHVLTLTKLLIKNNNIEGIASFLKEIEEIFQLKRNTYYSYVSSTDEIKGVLGKDIIGINQLRRTMDSQRPFKQSYKTKKVIHLQDLEQVIEGELIDRYGLKSLLIVPVFDSEKVFGWMVLDNKDNEINISEIEMSNLGTTGELLGAYLSVHNLFNWENEEGIITHRDKEILYLLADGLGNKEIGLRLFISEYTVRDLIGQLMLKFEVKNRTELVAKAIRQKMIH